VPVELRSEFINEVAEEYIRHYPVDNGGFVHIKAVRLEIEAMVCTTGKK